MEKYSELQCPHCGHTERIEMPEDNCMYFYRCTKCETIITPKKGDCCVFCSYGTVPCPPIQQEKNCCIDNG